ncbi:MAG: hypothetical protein AAF597_08795, partial [Bacteroidota bacterium]
SEELLTTATAAAVPQAPLDTLPPGYRYDITTHKQLDHDGKVLSVSYDTSIIATRFRYDTLFYTDEAGNLSAKIASIDTAIFTDTLTTSAVDPSQTKKATRLAPVPALTFTAPPPSTAPASAPKQAYDLTPKPSRERPVTRLPFPLPWLQVSYDDYYHWRMEQVLLAHPVKVVPSKTYNGYFPAYREDFR